MQIHRHSSFRLERERIFFCLFSRFRLNESAGGEGIETARIFLKIREGERMKGVRSS